MFRLSQVASRVQRISLSKQSRAACSLLSGRDIQKECSSRSLSLLQQEARLAVGSIPRATTGSRRWFSSGDYPPHTAVPLPALSPTMETGTIISWEKNEGDELCEGDLLAEIETDKATMGFETPEEGYLAKILVSAGTKGIAIGQLVCIIVAEKEQIDAFKDYKAESIGDSAPAEEAPSTPKESTRPAATAPPPAAAPVTPAAAASTPATVTAGAAGRLFASPLAKTLAAERGVSLEGLSGSGPGGRIRAADVPAAGAAAAATAPMSAYRSPTSTISHDGPQYEDIPVTSMRSVIAKRLVQSKTTIPHYYLAANLNVDQLLAMRASMNAALSGEKLSVNDFIIKASALACLQVPEVNSSWMDTFIRQYNTVDMSIAVSTDAGLITPIVFNAESKGLLAINRDVKRLAAAARANKLRPEEFQGGSFALSNLGMFGVENFGAVINPPQAAILAVGGVRRCFIEEDGEGRFASVVGVTLSLDHRVVDGAVGARWLQHFKRFIESPGTMLL